MLIKKYGNRRLYDVTRSRYVTLEDLADGVRAGDELRVLDATTGEELTDATLAQLFFEQRGAARRFSRSLLTQLIRLPDDALAELLGETLPAALAAFVRARPGLAVPFGARKKGAARPAKKAPPPRAKARRRARA